MPTMAWEVHVTKDFFNFADSWCIFKAPQDSEEDLRDLVEIDALVSEQPTHKKVRVEAKCKYCGAYAKDICYDCESVVCGRHIHSVRPFSPVVEDKHGELRDSDVVENWVTCVECAKEMEDLDTYGR